MSRRSQRSAPPETEYLAAIEARLSELARAPLILSTRDFERVRGWRERGVPLEVVLRAMGDVLGRPRDGGEGERAARAYSLAYCERAVEQRFKAQREGAVGRAGAPAPGAARIAGALRALAREVRQAAARALRRSPAGNTLARDLRALAARLGAAARGLRSAPEPLAAATSALLSAEADLRASLRQALGGDLDRLAAQEGRRLAGRLASMTPQAAVATIQASLLQRLRQELGVPALDAGSLNARLHAAPARRRLTSPSGTT